MRLVGLGIAIGIPIALVAVRSVSSLLFGLSARDPATIVSSTLVLGLVGLFAAFWPARRAARLDPVKALRHE
jgi:ABC-type antimicrobial peptide transport system permease subunit